MNEEKSKDSIAKRDFATFRKMTDSMIGTSNQAYRSWERYERTAQPSDRDTIEKIIKQGTLSEKRELSKRYFLMDGFYRRLMIHHATLLTYAGILVPKVKNGQSISSAKTKKRYYDAATFCDYASFPDIFTHCTLRAVVEGCYYGVVQTLNKTKLVLMDLPPEFCRTRYKDFNDLPILEFNVTYFITKYDDERVRDAAVLNYPAAI